MSKIQEIKEALLEARKNKYVGIASLLSTVIGDAEMVGKNAGNRAPTDAEVIQVLKKFEKNMLETQGYLKETDPRHAMITVELDIVKCFLPAKITDEQVLCDIKFIMGSRGLAYEQKSMGELTKELKIKYGDRFDGKQVSSIFKSML